MVAIAATVASVGVVVALCFLLLKFTLAVREYRKTCYFMRQFPHVPGSIIFGNLFDVRHNVLVLCWACIGVRGTGGEGVGGGKVPRVLTVQGLTSTYKLNLPNKALQVLMFASQSLQV